MLVTENEAYVIVSLLKALIEEPQKISIRNRKAAIASDTP